MAVSRLQWSCQFGNLVSFASYLVDPDPQTPLLLHKKNAASEEAKPVSENTREGIEKIKASRHEIW